jgi:hypothetical protein
MMRLSIRHLNSLADLARSARFRNEWEMRHRRPGYILDGSRFCSIVSSRVYFVDNLVSDLARLLDVLPTLASGIDDVPGYSGGSTYTVFPY